MSEDQIEIRHYGPDRYASALSQDEVNAATRAAERRQRWGKVSFSSPADLALTVASVVLLAISMVIGYAWGSDLPDGAYVVPSAEPSSAAVERLERVAACRCADRSVDQ